MITNFNASKDPSNSNFDYDFRKYIGVASVNILAINPDNAKLREYGWNIPEDADEPAYTFVVERNGKQVKTSRVRFLVKVTDLEEQPVIPLDFWCSQEVQINNEGSKCKIIDSYGRTAWGTKEEVTKNKIPQYTGGAANIATPYKMCHRGEEELVTFLFKYLNITPLQVYDRLKGGWVNTKNPGQLTIDNWNAIVNGDIKEIAEYVALQPDNKVKVIFGVKNTDDNRSYQAFLNTGYLGNGSIPDKNTGEYTSARKLIDRYFAGRTDSPYVFDACPVKEWQVTATAVSENTGDMFDEPTSTSEEVDDLPFFE